MVEFSVQDQDWVQRGGDLDDEESNDYLKKLVALSKDGSIITIGAHFIDRNRDKVGHVHVYHYSTTDEYWVQRGEDTNGKATRDESRLSVDISAGSTIVAIGLPETDE